MKENTLEHTDIELDVRGLKCPLPILRAKKALSGLQSGQILRVHATDPGSVRDFEAFARQTGHELLETLNGEGEEHVFRLRRK